MAKGIEIKRSKLLKNSIKLSPRCRRVIKYLIVLLCVSGLAFQVTQLVLQYLSRRTIVHLEFETLWYNRLPAITICYPNMIAMNKTAERFAQLKPVYNQYKKRLAEANDYEFHDRKLRQKLDDIYENDFLGFIRRQNLSFAQLAELSIPFTYKERVYTQPSLSSKTLNPSEHAYASIIHFGNESSTPIDVLLTGLRRFPNGTIRNCKVKDTKPIESLVFNHKLSNEMVKCFTFFSHLNRSMRYYQMNIKEIHITVRHHEDWFPFTIYKSKDQKLLFAMHSPNTIPQDWNTFMELETMWFYEIRYNRWKTVLLGPPYKTGCTKYDLDTTTGYRLRSDCLNHCITKELDRVCITCDREVNTTECDRCFIRSDFLWRLETARKNQDVTRRICNDYFEDANTEQDVCIRENQEQISHNCEAKCGPECHNRYYNFAIFSKVKLTDDLKDSQSSWDIETKIFIGHNQLPDQTTEHIEEMSFVTFAGNFGGLFGIWMGLSAYAILHYILKLI